MSGNLKIHLKTNERVFVNGAVLKVDRKVAIEFLNDVVFLLESHVLQQDQANTPLRQLYFLVQAMLIDPSGRDLANQFYKQSHRMLIGVFRNRDVLEGLMEVKECIEKDRVFDALKRIRSLYPLEEDILKSPSRLQTTTGQIVGGAR